jgi:hypothetical protein
MTYTKFRENLPEGWWSPVNTEQDRLKELPLTSSTVAVKVGRHGVTLLMCTSLINPVYLITEIHMLALQEKKNSQCWNISYCGSDIILYIRGGQLEELRGPCSTKQTMRAPCSYL